MTTAYIVSFDANIIKIGTRSYTADLLNRDPTKKDMLRYQKSFI